MKLERIFKNIVALNFLSILYLIGLGFFEAEASIELPETDLLWPLSIYLLLLPITLYFLYTFKPIGKKLFLPLVLISSLISIGLPLEYFQIDSVDQYLVEYIAAAADGAILLMLYFTDIKKKFI